MVALFKAGIPASEIAPHFDVTGSTVSAHVSEARKRGENIPPRSPNDCWMNKRLGKRSEMVERGNAFDRRVWDKGWSARPDDAPDPLTLLDDAMPRNGCRWPLGRNEAGEELFCGLPHSRPYCKHHRQVAYTKVSEDDDAE